MIAEMLSIQSRIDIVGEAMHHNLAVVAFAHYNLLQHNYFIVKGGKYASYGW